ncbi:hypothetical protein [Halomonas sp. M20]|uniref:hypothetical protein n=1 Tax=Halomonas sp. M20 TaxID=2763264 RepID=UPI001D0B97E7|nr:hypothetical protein [Halomonas sp. M20]
MKKSVVISIIAAILTFFLLSLMFSGTSNNAGFLSSLDPVNAVKGLSFALSFAAGMPIVAAVVAAIAVFVLVPVAVFSIAYRFLRRYDG